MLAGNENSGNDDFEIKVLGIVKDKWEIDLISKACAITTNAYNDAMMFIHERSGNVTEKDVAGKIKNYFSDRGCPEAFGAIVAFGENAANIHHEPTDTKLEEDDMVMIDMGSKYKGYCSDMTRSFVYKPKMGEDGKYNPITRRKKNMIVDVHESQKKGLAEVYAGNKIKNVDLAARKYLYENGYNSIPHSVGHGVGTEIHEPPRVNMYNESPLLEGMVITVEPGAYVKGFGGARIEDTLVVTKKGFKRLTNAPYNKVME